jgi:UDP-glucose 4-epimerase
MTILVTGGAGFIGSQVAECFADDVVVLDDLSTGFVENVPTHCKFIEGSICDEKLVEQIFRDFKVGRVYHCAAYAAEVFSMQVPKHTYTTNVLGSLNLIKESIRNDVDCFVFCSSIAVYGDAKAMVEDFQALPIDPYGWSKLVIEKQLQMASKNWNLPFVIFRPHNVYGCRQNVTDVSRNVVGIFIKQAIEGLPFSIYGDGTQTRAFTFIDDIVDLIADSPNMPELRNGIFNIGSDSVYSVNEIAKFVAEACGTAFGNQYLPYRHEVQHAVANHSKLNSIVGLSETPIEIGIQRMAKWAVEAKAVQRHTKSRATEIGTP